VQVLWQRFQQTKKFEALADVSYLCSGKAGHFEATIAKKKTYTSQPQWKSFTSEIQVNDKRNQFGSLGRDHGIEAVAEKIAAAYLAEMEYMRSLIPPNFNDRDWCHRTQCLDRFNVRREQLENELEQCKQISEWYID
jgi:hypothetical protein